MSDQASDAGSRGGVVALAPIIDLAKRYNLEATAFVFTFKSVAMPNPHTDAEFVSCCLVAREHALNPLTKEIYFMRSQSGQIQPIVSVDGWMKKLNEHPKFDGMEFEDLLDADGKMTACTIVIHMKDKTYPIRVTEYMEECRGSSTAWKKTERRMLRHRTLTQGARYAVGFAGVMDRDEFEQWQAMRDVTPTKLVASTVEPPDPDAMTIGENTASDTGIAEIDQSATGDESILAQIETRLDRGDSVETVEREFENFIMCMGENERQMAYDMIEAKKENRST